MGVIVGVMVGVAEGTVGVGECEGVDEMEGMMETALFTPRVPGESGVLPAHAGIRLNNKMKAARKKFFLIRSHSCNARMSGAFSYRMQNASRF